MVRTIAAVVAPPPTRPATPAPAADDAGEPFADALARANDASSREPTVTRGERDVADGAAADADYGDDDDPAAARAAEAAAALSVIVAPWTVRTAVASLTVAAAAGTVADGVAVDGQPTDPGALLDLGGPSVPSGAPLLVPAIAPSTAATVAGEGGASPTGAPVPGAPAVAGTAASEPVVVPAVPTSDAHTTAPDGPAPTPLSVLAPGADVAVASSAAVDPLPSTDTDNATNPLAATGTDAATPNVGDASTVRGAASADPDSSPGSSGGGASTGAGSDIRPPMLDANAASDLFVTAPVSTGSVSTPTLASERIAVVAPSAAAWHQAADELAGGATRVRIVVRVDPPELGPVDVQFVARGREVHMTLTAADPSVPVDLRNQEQVVRQALESRGFDLAGFDVGGERRGDDRRSASTSRVAALDLDLDAEPVNPLDDGALRL